MSKLLWIVAALCILMLSGCATPTAIRHFQPVLDSKRNPESGSAYVAGMFNREWMPDKSDFAIGITNTATAEEYLIPFGVETVLYADLVDRPGMIQIPPGQYRISYWAKYSTKEHGQVEKTGTFSDPQVGLPFTVGSGEVLFIGGFVASKARNTGSSGDLQWSVRQQRFALQSAQKALSSSYPLFANQPLSCPSCLK